MTIYRTHEELQFMLSLFHLEASDDLTDQHKQVRICYGQCLMIVRLLRVSSLAFIVDAVVGSKHLPKRVSSRKKPFFGMGDCLDVKIRILIIYK